MLVVREVYDTIRISIHALRVEGGTILHHIRAVFHQISIHALRVEGDGAAAGKAYTAGISIHALRVEGDDTGKSMNDAAKISIHALRVEGDCG